MPAARCAAAVLALVGGYAFGVRPRLLRWGATEEEVRRPFPGADVVPGGTRSATMAATWGFLLEELPGRRTRTSGGSLAGPRPLDNRKISSYCGPMPRRKPGTLLPLEAEILEGALSMLRSRQTTFYGFGLAQTMREQSGSRSLTGHGTLYKALSRLEELGLLTSRWEDAAAAEGRPRRRLYELTKQGAHVAEQALGDKADRANGRFPRVAPEPV